LTGELRKLESRAIKDPMPPEYEGDMHLVRISAYLRDLIELLIDTYELDELVSSSSS